MNPVEPREARRLEMNATGIDPTQPTTVIDTSMPNRTYSSDTSYTVRRTAVTETPHSLAEKWNRKKKAASLRKHRETCDRNRRKRKKK